MFRREALCCLDVAFVAARSLPTRKPIPASGALLNDLLLVCGLALLLQADLRASPRLELFATDASPSGAGACVAPVPRSLWHTLYNLAEEHGEHVRLSWGSSAPPSSSSRHHGVLVLPSLLLPIWSVLFSYQFRQPDHINVLELTALTSLIKHLGNRGARRQRILCCVDSRVVLGAVSKGRSSSRRLNFCLRRLAFECLSASLSVDLLWVPSWGNLADAPSRSSSLCSLAPVPPDVARTSADSSVRISSRGPRVAAPTRTPARVSRSEAGSLLPSRTAARSSAHPRPLMAAEVTY